MLFALLMLLCAEEFFSQNAPTAEFYLDTRHGSSLKLEKNIFQYKSGLPLKIIIHGWTEDANRTHYINMAKAFLKHDDCYVIRVDYSAIAGQNYLFSATSVGTVGNFIADYLVKLTKQLNIPMKQVHIIGHSLGGQVSGYVGRRVIEVTGQKLHRISALDPARPLFENNFDSLRLSKKDAEIVDVVHTDGGILGCENALGTADFFPNGGRRMQPGCNYEDESSFLPWEQSSFYCSHHKSYVYYTISILTEIWARKCNSWKDYINGICDQNEQVLFGAWLPENVTGSYYFELDIDNDYVQDVLLSSGV